MSPNRKALAAIAGISLVTGGLVFFTFDGEQRAIAKAPPPAPAAPSVEVIEAMARTLPETASFTGRLTAVQHVDLRPRIGGYVAAVRFPEGSIVKRGQVLFEIDARPYAAAVARAKAQLRQAEARSTLAQRKASRARVLRADDVIAQAELDAAIAEETESSAAVGAARAYLQTASIDLEDTRVRAPIDGRIGEAIVTAGNLVSSGTLLTTIVSIDPLHVELDIDESTFRRLATDRAATPVHVTLADESGEGRPAAIDFLANRVDATTGTARARAVIANKDGQLTPGLFARVRLETGAPRAVVLIRDEAIGTSAQGRYVLVVKPDGTVDMRRVELGERVDGLRAIRSGVAAGEHVVLKGMARPGMTVTPKVVPMTGGAS